MVIRQNIDLEIPYSDEDLAGFSKTLEVDAFSHEQSAKLQHAALEYIFLAEIEAKPRPGDTWESLTPSRKDRRADLKRVAKAARALRAALETMTISYLRPENPPDPAALETFAQWADSVAEAVPRTGAEPKLARQRFATRLAQIYVDVTGRRPTMQRYIISKSKTPFFAFVEGALQRLDQHAAQGLEADVRKAVTELKNSRAK